MPNSGLHRIQGLKHGTPSHLLTPLLMSQLDLGKVDLQEINTYSGGYLIHDKSVKKNSERTVGGLRKSVRKTSERTVGGQGNSVRKTSERTVGGLRKSVRKTRERKVGGLFNWKTGQRMNPQQIFLFLIEMFEFAAIFGIWCHIYFVHVQGTFHTSKVDLTETFNKLYTCYIQVTYKLQFTRTSYKHVQPAAYKFDTSHIDSI